MADDIDLTQGLAALLAEAENPARGALKALPVTPTMGSADPSNFREGTLLGLLGRYSPSGSLSRHWDTVSAPAKLLGLDPDTREGHIWKGKIGGLADDATLAFGLPAIAKGLYGGYQGAKGMIAATNEVPKGPWNSRMLEDMLDARGPLPARHELNVPEAPGSKPLVPRSNEQLEAEQRALIKEGHDFLTESPEGQRRSFTAIESGFAPTNAQKLADAVRAHGNANMNIPGVEANAEALARRLEGLEAAQWPYRNLNYDNFFNIQRVADRYGDDIARTFGKAKAEQLGMGQRDFHRILNEFGADPNDPQSVERAYKDFWRKERELLAAGKPTLHDQEAIVQQKMQDNETRRLFGLEPDDPRNKEAIDKAWRAELEKAMADMLKAKDAYHRRTGGSSDAGDRFESNPTARSIADKVWRYGPPGAVTAYGLAKTGDLASMLMEQQRARRDIPSPPDPNRP